MAQICYDLRKSSNMTLIGPIATLSTRKWYEFVADVESHVWTIGDSRKII